MRIGFKIILDRNVTIPSPEGFECTLNEITVEFNKYALSYEEMMQEIFNNPEKAYFWRDKIKYVADKVVRYFMKINNVSDLHRLDIKFCILLEDEYPSYIVNFLPCDYLIQRVAYNLIEIDRGI